MMRRCSFSGLTQENPGASVSGPVLLMDSFDFGRSNDRASHCERNSDASRLYRIG